MKKEAKRKARIEQRREENPAQLRKRQIKKLYTI